MENNTNLLGQLNISNYSIHIFSKYIHELIFDNVVYQNHHNLARYGGCWYKGKLECPRPGYTRLSELVVRGKSISLWGLIPESPGVFGILRKVIGWLRSYPWDIVNMRYPNGRNLPHIVESDVKHHQPQI